MTIIIPVWLLIVIIVFVAIRTIAKIIILAKNFKNLISIVKDLTEFKKKDE